MNYHEITQYLGRTVQVRYFMKNKTYSKKIDDNGDERYMDIVKKVPSTIVGIAKVCTDQTLIICLMDDDEDIEIPIKLKDINRIKIAKIIKY